MLHALRISMTIVCVKDFETQLMRLREVFEHLCAANSKLHVNRCFLFQCRVAFVGHILSENGIEVQEDKVSAVRD